MQLVKCSFYESILYLGIHIVIGLGDGVLILCKFMVQFKGGKLSILKTFSRCRTKYNSISTTTKGSNIVSWGSNQGKTLWRAISLVTHGLHCQYLVLHSPHYSQTPFPYT